MMKKNLRMRMSKIHTHRAREIGTKGVIFLDINSYNNNLLTKCYKVTLYSDYLGETALYDIYKNSPNLGCPKGQCEYSHYTLIFDTPP